MKNKGQFDAQEKLMEGLMDRFLKVRSSSQPHPDQGHLDGDVVAAFVEGNLTEKESAPVTSHLVACSMCRHKSAELARLAFEFAEEPAALPVEAKEPSSVGEVLSGILGRIFGGGEGAVFAHQEPEEDSEEEMNDDSDESKKD